jgi:hypothetical protein
MEERKQKSKKTKLLFFVIFLSTLFRKIIILIQFTLRMLCFTETSVPFTCGKHKMKGNKFISLSRTAGRTFLTF